MIVQEMRDDAFLVNPGVISCLVFLLSSHSREVLPFGPIAVAVGQSSMVSQMI